MCFFIFQSLHGCPMGRFLKLTFALCMVGTLCIPNSVQALNIEVYQGGSLKGTIDAYTGSITGAANYNFTPPPHSGFPINGPSQVELAGLRCSSNAVPVMGLTCGDSKSHICPRTSVAFLVWVVCNVYVLFKA